MAAFYVFRRERPTGTGRNVDSNRKVRFLHFIKRVWKLVCVTKNVGQLNSEIGGLAWPSAFRKIIIWREGHCRGVIGISETRVMLMWFMRLKNNYKAPNGCVCNDYQQNE